MAIEANAVRGEIVPFPADRIMWIRPAPASPVPFGLEPGQVAVVLEGVTMVYASREAFEARFAAPPAKPAGSRRGHLVAIVIGVALAALVVGLGL